MKKLLLAALGSVSAFAAAMPAQSAVLLPGTVGVFSPFDVTTQGTLLDSMQVSGSAPTVAGTLRSAVFRNTAGTLDFYYQVVHTAGNAIGAITAAPFHMFSTDTFFWDADPDGAGIFTAENNGPLFGLDDATAMRSLDGNVVTVDFNIANPVGAGETSSTYIFRTNATEYVVGTGGVIDGTAFSVAAFAPVPEPATWAMMLVGFGAVGYSMRRRPRYRLVQAV